MESTSNMEANADSDLEGVKVFWGPVTVDEIKTVLTLKRNPAMIGSRSSICNDNPSRTIYCNSPTKDLLFKQQFCDTDEPELETSFWSKYYTPNETLRDEKSDMSTTTFTTVTDGSQAEDNFIEKVSKVLNLSSSNPSSYASAAECSNLVCCKERCSTTASFKFDDVACSDICQKSDDMGELKPNQTFDESHLGREIDTILVSSDDDDYNCNSPAVVLSNIPEESIWEDDIKNSSEPEVCVISDGDSSFEMQQEIRKEKIPKQKTDESQQQPNSANFYIKRSSLESSKLFKCKDSNTINLNKRNSGQKGGHINEDCLEMINFVKLEKVIIEEELNKKSNVNPIEVVDLTETDADNSVLESDTASGVTKVTTSYNNQHNEVSVELNDSSSSSEFKFNDTLEEMELALNYGLDYPMPAECGISNLRSVKVNSKQKCNSSVTDVHLQPYETKNLTSPYCDTNKQMKTPTKNLYSPSKLQKNCSAKGQVKVPLKPLPVIKTPDFKNVASPIAVYINNSPRVPRVQHVTPKSLSAESLFLTPSIDNSVLDGDTASGVTKIITSYNNQHNELSGELNGSSSSSEFKFNDTLEEMELALNYGLDYTMPAECGMSNLRSDKVNSKQKCNSSVIDVHLQPYETKNLTSPYCDTNKQMKTPTKNLYSPSKLQKNCSDKGQFKVPLKPLPVIKTPDFKNVASPISVYIKNSPRVPRVQHVTPKSLAAGSLFLTPSTIKTSNNKENLDLPNCIYQPAKHTVTSKEKVLKLPGNIKKHLPVIPEIIKHTKRINKPTNMTSVEEKLLADDLTVCYSNAADSSETVQDISLLTIKKAYIT